MINLPGWKRVGQLLLTGKHDTITFNDTACIGRCRTHEGTLVDQLRNGIRFLELRMSQGYNDGYI